MQITMLLLTGFNSYEVTFYRPAHCTFWLQNQMFYRSMLYYHLLLSVIKSIQLNHDFSVFRMNKITEFGKDLTLLLHIIVLS